MEPKSLKSCPFLLTKRCQFLLLLLFRPMMQFPQVLLKRRRLLRFSPPSLRQLAGRGEKRTRKQKRTQWNPKPQTVKCSSQNCCKRLLISPYSKCSALRENISFARLVLLVDPRKLQMSMEARAGSPPGTVSVTHQASPTPVRTL